MQGSHSVGFDRKPAFGVQRQFSHFSEGVQQDVLAMLAEMNQKIELITDKKSQSDRLETHS